MPCPGLARDESQESAGVTPPPRRTGGRRTCPGSRLQCRAPPLQGQGRQVPALVPPNPSNICAQAPQPGVRSPEVRVRPAHTTRMGTRPNSSALFLGPGAPLRTYGALQPEPARSSRPAHRPRPASWARPRPRPRPSRGLRGGMRVGLSGGEWEAAPGWLRAPWGTSRPSSLRSSWTTTR